MFCAKCHHQHNLLACPRCAEENGRKGYMKQQQMLLPAVLRNGAELTLARRGGSGLFHIQLLGEPLRSFCWEALLPPQRRQYAPLGKLKREEVCARCLHVFDEAVRAVTA